MTNLYQSGLFKLSSGRQSFFKIDCDALTEEDWITLANMALSVLTPFSAVEGVPNGGIAFAKALERYIEPGANKLLIAEDVVTTGASMERQRNGRDARGICVYNRALSYPRWIHSIFRIHPMLAE